MDREALKARVREAIQRRAPAAIDVAQDILEHPETGFRETRTARLVAGWFRDLGLPLREGIAVTGVRADIVGGRPGPTVAVMGELDSLIVPEHPKAFSETGAAHACGHHAQIGTLLAVAAAMSQPEIRDLLGGRVALMAVPAEECIELEYRMELCRQGKIEFLGGKPEFIRLGLFDDVDMAMLTHTTSRSGEGFMAMGGTNNGVVAKQVRFIGVSAHAGAAPHRGVNALNAAMLALNAIHANRETFPDADTVRVHPIITKGGDSVNAVPADVRMEMFVRGKTLGAIEDAGRKVDRSLRAGAMAVGARVRITTLPGYLPIRNYQPLARVYRANAEAVVGPDRVAQVRHRTSSTDMGDVSHLMPTIQPYAGGASGQGHGADFLIDDYEQAVVNPAMVTALTLVDLLVDGAEGSQAVLDGYKPAFTKAEYLELMRGLSREEEYAEGA